MNPLSAGQWLKKTVVVAAVVLMAAGAVKALQALNVSDLSANPSQSFGGGGDVTGMVGPVKVVTRNRNGQMTQMLVFNLYEVKANGRRGSHYVYVYLPASQFSVVPAEGQMLTVTGTLKPPYEVAVIEQ